MSNDYIGWDGKIENDGQFALLEPGEYSFVVATLDKTTSNSSGAPMAVVTLDVYGDTAQATVRDYLVLTRAAEWKLSAFFRALGMKKHGEPFVMDWDAVEGKTGRAEIYVDEYLKQDGTPGKTNKVRQYLDKDAAKEDLPAAPAAAAPSTPEDDIPF